MIAIYESLSGQGARFAEKLGIPTMDIWDYDGEQGPFILITRSEHFGEVPPNVIEFMDEHADKVIGIAACGNLNWGSNFGAAGDKLSQQYGKELILKFEGSGFNSDVQYMKEWIQNHMEEK